ncbi:MAG: class I SAM-dependent methyltransferase [Planctomycetales bacterium]|nr:class I SAM-dependent methyltransferase [Planctomycetales bacterium]
MGSTYDQIPYPSLPIQRTHPSHLAAVARLFGMLPTSPKNCRVLELGCAAGNNLLLLASHYPKSEFVGVDSSVTQIEEGLAAVNELRLENISLEAMDLLDIDESFGAFDYVICHGVFSWVPHSTQTGILEIGRRCLAPNGVFFISYNTYPGWHMRRAVRDMILVRLTLAGC